MIARFSNEHNSCESCVSVHYEGQKPASCDAQSGEQYTYQLEWSSTDNLSNLENLFREMTDLITLDASNFDFSEVEDMTEMFYKCSSLE